MFRSSSLALFRTSSMTVDPITISEVVMFLIHVFFSIMSTQR